MTLKQLEAIAHQTAIEISPTRVADIHVKRCVLQALIRVNHSATISGTRRGRILRDRAASDTRQIARR